MQCAYGRGSVLRVRLRDGRGAVCVLPTTVLALPYFTSAFDKGPVRVHVRVCVLYVGSRVRSRVRLRVAIDSFFTFRLPLGE